MRTRRRRAPSDPDAERRPSPKDRSSGGDALDGFGSAFIAVGLVAAIAGVVKAVKGHNEKGNVDREEDTREEDEQREKEERRQARRERRRQEEMERAAEREQDERRMWYNTTQARLENGREERRVSDETRHTRLLEYQTAQDETFYQQQQQQQRQYAFQDGSYATSRGPYQEDQKSRYA